MEMPSSRSAARCHQQGHHRQHNFDVTNAISVEASVNLARTKPYTRAEVFLDYGTAALHQSTSRSVNGQNDDSTTTLLRKTLPTHHKLFPVVEAISMTLKDVNGESYGKRGTIRHNFVELLFHPDRYVWEAKGVCNRMTMTASSNGDDGHHYGKDKRAQNEERIETRTFSVYIQCFEIDPFYDEEDDDDNSDSDDSSYSDGDSELVGNIFCIDVTLSSLQRGTSQIESGEELTLLEKVFEHICYDIARSLAKLGIPYPPQDHRKKFREVYKLHKKLNSGSFGSVCLGTHRVSNRQIAAKLISRRSFLAKDDVAVYNEVDILSSLKHKYICSLESFFIQDDCYIIALEYMSGGDLFDRLSKLKTYDECDARDLCFKLLEAIAYCHDNDIVHCDLKPKNLLLEDDNTTIKLADFGFASRLYASNSLTKRCGTLYFVAPEILSGNAYDEKADMWSVGVTIFSLLSGQLPFHGKNTQELKGRIISGQFVFDEEAWDGISDSAKDLVKAFLVTDPESRLSARLALETSEWLKLADAKKLKRNSLEKTSERLKTFNARLAFKSAILASSFIFRLKSLAEKTRRRSNSELSTSMDDTESGIPMSMDGIEEET